MLIFYQPDKKTQYEFLLIFAVRAVLDRSYNLNTRSYLIYQRYSNTGIHRNTLSYRIEKTAELLHLDDFNEELLSVLKTSFSLYDVLDLCK